MHKYIVLLKGINVGGHRKVPMAELKVLLAKHDFRNVQTYIQSGNIFLESSSLKPFQIEDIIQKALYKYYGFEVSVLVKTAIDLKRIFEDCPFSEAKRKDSYYVLLHDVPTKQQVEQAYLKEYEFDEYVILKDCIYLYCEKGMGASKFNMKYFENKLNTFATTRNYNTMAKLLSLSFEE